MLAQHLLVSITVRFSPSRQSSVNLDAHKSFINKGVAQVWCSDLVKLELDKEKILVEGWAHNINFTPLESKSQISCKFRKVNNIVAHLVHINFASTC